MPDYRAIKAVTPARPIDMGGLEVKQPLPHQGLRYHDPFLLLHHANWVAAGDRHQRDEGVPPHPHRGFEPVTFIQKGSIHHRDSRGNDSVIHAGGVQWTTAGMGIIHSERPSREIAEKGGELEIIQLWVNLPAKLKMTQPRYQGFQKEEIPVIERDGTSIQVVAGEFEGVKGPVRTHTPVLALNGTIAASAHREIELPEGSNAFAYFLDGEVTLNEDENVKGHRLAAFEVEGERVRIDAKQDTRFILMAGKPHGEEVARSGPFVMNDQTQILEAMRDAQMGKMGVLIEEF